MHRSLRLELVASVVVTVAIGFGVSQWLGTRLSERALEQDLRDRTLLVTQAVESVLQPGGGELRHQLAALVGAHRPVSAVEVFRFGDSGLELTETTRGAEGSAVPTLQPEVLAQVRRGQVVSVPLEAGDVGWRLIAPIRGRDSISGAVQVELHPTEFEQLKRRLRLLDGVTLIVSMGLVCLVLMFLLERRVTRPVSALVDGMKRAERGDLSGGVQVPASLELEYLGRSYNGMMAKLRASTGGLQERVARATEELAVKNRELQVANEKLAAAQLEVARAERLAAHGQMAATLAHELGTPLNSVLGYTQLLLRDSPTSQQVQKLSIIESQVQRMADTIRGALDQSRDRATRHCVVSLESIVADALTVVSPLVESRGLAIRSVVGKYVPPVNGDSTGLRQVVVNLLTNAIDACATSGGVTVEVAAGSEDVDGSPYVDLVVADTGEGMKPEELRHIHEPFYTTKGSSGGTGLGLVVVHHIVHAHGARLWVESHPGQGTTVRVRFPASA